MPRAKSGKRRSGVSFKWTKELILLIVGLLVLIAITIVCLVPTQNDRLVSEYTGTDTSTTYLSTDNVYKKISYKKLMKMVEKNDDETFFVYYATGLDSNCQTNIVTLNTLADTYSVERIYLLDAKDAYNLNEEDDDYYEELAVIESREEELNLLKAGNGIDDIELDTYSQLWAFAKDSETGNTELVFSSSTLLNDKYVSGTTFEFAVKTCFGKYANIVVNA